MKGEVVYYHIYDLGAEVDLDRVLPALLSSAPEFEAVEITKTAPKYVNLPKPLTLRLGKATRETTAGAKTFEIQARVFDIGAIAFALRLPFEVAALSDLAPLGGLKLLEDGREVSLDTLSREYRDAIYGTLRTGFVETYPVTSEPETYAVYCLTDVSVPKAGDAALVMSVEDLLLKHRQTLAGLLSGEADPKRLGPEEVEDNLRYWFRYYEEDLVLVDWDYALLVEPSGKYEDLLYVMELANLQLLELRTYDRYLDDVLTKAYGDVDKSLGRGGLLRSARHVQHDLSEARIDLIRVMEKIDNIGKIFGDWYLAKLYLALTARFHLAEWEDATREKMNTLEDLYELASHEVEHRRGIFLESLIVLLFVVDLLLLWLVSGG